MSQALSSPSRLRLKFLEYLFGEEQEGYLCIAYSNKVKGQFKQAFYKWPTEKQTASNFIDQKANDHNIWFGVNLLKNTQRSKINCLPSDLVWADLDYVNPETISPPPTCVIESSPSRYQGYWRLEETIPADVAELFSKRIAYATGADKSGWPLTKLLRVPHTLNFKYEQPAEIKVLRAFETRVPIEVFDEVPDPPMDEAEAEKWGLVTQGEDTPDVNKLPNPETIIYSYRGELTLDGNVDTFVKLFASEPPEQADWSALLWRLINICAEVGMEREETFSIAFHAKCNKYKRDNRPVSQLWKEVCKAHINQSKVALIKEAAFQELKMPQLVDPDTFEEDSFIVEYKKWGVAATDAPEHYHELACFVALSALTSAGLKLDTSFGELVPNLWGLILGESTLTRKTTVMRMAMDIVTDLDESIILATDGSAEGLLSGLSGRPRRVSVFYKDEVSGFFDSINRKDYLAGMQETLTQLYDVPKVLQRLLRKETVTIAEPYFIFFGGGIRDKVYSLIDEEYILSGFLPRFLVVSGENDLARIRRTGPPTEDIWSLKQNVVNSMGELKVRYNLQAQTQIAGQDILMPARVEAKLTDEAWQFYGDLEMKLIEVASASAFPMVALPTFQRLAFSMLKMSLLVAITRKEPKDNQTIPVEKSDIQQAAYYIQRWGEYSVELLANAGKADIEKLIDKIMQQIQANPGLNKGTIMRHWRLSARSMKEISDTLLERGLINVAKKGRTVRYYPIS